MAKQFDLGKVVGETPIDDVTPSRTKVYSSQKVESIASQLSEQKVDKANWTAGKNVVTDASGNITTEDKLEIPTTLPNPRALTINGESYDGSKAVEMNIEGGGGALYNNLADNSDFEHWVAQADIGGMHGAQAYGGDRWILENGTIASTAYDGEPNPDSDGYSGIQLNGTLVQVVPSPPAVATPFIEMVSGTAEISYDASVGEITIASAGGVIKNVLLLEGEWTEKPEYVSKGYAAELTVCQRYFITGVGTHTAGHGGVIESKLFYINIPTPSTMRSDPVCIIDLADNVVFGTISGYSICSVTGVSGIDARKNSVFVELTLNSNLPQHYATGSTFGTSLSLVADLPRR